MKKLFLCLATLASTTALAADDVARVVDIQPRYTTTLQQQCHIEQVRVDNSGVGTVIGGVTGGIVGNQVGKGTGKDVATVLGAVVGASVGSRIGQDQAGYEQRQVCRSVPITQQIGETVTFEYRGRRFNVQF
jgi:outer membrane lipoprotein SlyB